MLRIVSYNIRFGGGRRIPLLAATVASLKPDLVLLQEATNPMAVERLARDAGFGHVLQQAGWSVAALARRAARVARLAPAAAGSWASWRSSRPVVAGLRLPRRPSARPGLSLRGERARLRHVDALLEVMGGATGPSTSLLGDLNSVAPGDEPRVAAMPFWLRLLLRFDGGVRTDVLRRLLDAGWVDAYRHLHPTDAGFTLPRVRRRSGWTTCSSPSSC